MPAAKCNNKHIVFSGQGAFLWVFQPAPTTWDRAADRAVNANISAIGSDFFHLTAGCNCNLQLAHVFSTAALCFQHAFRFSSIFLTAYLFSVFYWQAAARQRLQLQHPHMWPATRSTSARLSCFPCNTAAAEAASAKHCYCLLMHYFALFSCGNWKCNFSRWRWHAVGVRVRIQCPESSNQKPEPGQQLPFFVASSWNTRK